MSSWVKHHFKHLSRWREYALSVADAAAELDPDAETYVIGGVAEDRTTIYSDIDILVVLKKRVDKMWAHRQILWGAVDRHGLPWDAPVELHIVVGEKEAQRYLSHSKSIRVEHSKPY